MVIWTACFFTFGSVVLFFFPPIVAFGDNGGKESVSSTLLQAKTISG